MVNSMEDDTIYGIFVGSERKNQQDLWSQKDL